MLIRNVRFTCITGIDVDKKCNVEWHFMKERKYYVSKYPDNSGIPGNKEEYLERNLYP
jgi:hypothetical protein